MFSKRVENTMEKRRNCSLRAISTFSTVFSKDLNCRYIKTRACLGKDYLLTCHSRAWIFFPGQYRARSTCTHEPLLTLNFSPNNEILDQSKFKALADDKINGTKKWKFVLGMVENILGKGENAGYQHFLLFPKCFQKSPFSDFLKVGIVWEELRR